MDLVRKWMSGAVMTNNSMEDVASKFGVNWGRLAAVIVTLAQPCEIPQGCVSNSEKIEKKPNSPIQQQPLLSFWFSKHSFYFFTMKIQVSSKDPPLIQGRQ